MKQQINSRSYSFITYLITSARRWARWLLGLVVLLVVVGGVGAYLFLPTNQAEASNEVGTITVYTTLENAEANRYLRDFQLVFPQIQVNLVTQTTNQLTERLLAEQDAPQADVLWGVGVTNLLLFEWNDLLRPYAPVGSERMTPRFVDAHTPPYWVGFYLTLTAFCVNNDAAARRGLPVPHSWNDLIKPIYRRSLLFPNPNTSSTGLIALLTLFELYDERDAWRYLDELHKNIALYTTDEAQTCQLVNSGEYPIGIAQTDERLTNVQMIYPPEGSSWEIIAGALVRKDPIQPAALTFLDWAVSKSVMPLYARKSPLTGISTALSAPAGFPADPEKQLLKQDASWGAANRSRILREWLRRYSDKVEK